MILPRLRRLWDSIEPERPPSALAVIAANLVPLVGATAFAWNAGAVVILYWLECGIVGIINILKIGLAQGDPEPPLDAGGGALLRKWATIGFFVVHYGVFLAGAGGGAVFVAIAAGGTVPPPGAPGESFRQQLALLHLPAFGLAVGTIVLVASHLVRLNAYLERRDYLRITVTEQAFAPYPRLLMLLSAVLISGTLIAVMGNPVWALAGFVIGKTALDLTLPPP